MSLERIEKINIVLTGFLKILYLNLLWMVAVLLGLVVFSFGPATRALMAYYDGWFRLGEEPPVARHFWEEMKRAYLPTTLFGGGYLLVIGMTLVNLFYGKTWAIQAVNASLFLFLLILGGSSFYLLASYPRRTFSQTLRHALVMSLGFFPISLGAWAVALIGYLLLSRTYPALLFIGGPGLVCAWLSLVGIYINKRLGRESEEKSCKK